MTELLASPEGQLLAEALDLAPDGAVLHSREPLGSGSVVCFNVRDGDGGLLYYVDTSRLQVPAETGMLLGTPEQPEARVWLHPADPHLPALAPTAFDGALTGMLQRLGITAAEAAEFIVYRAGRRAVFRAPTHDGTVWVKILRPSRLERTLRAHTAFAEAGIPSPAVLGWSPDGLIVLDDAVGTPATDVVWNPHALLDQIDLLRASIATVPLTAPARGVAGQLDWYAARAQDLPGADALVQQLRQRLEPALTGEDVVVHGDLHYGQLFLADDGSISSVIDVDTAGLGAAAEDPAAFIAHTAASALLATGEVTDRVWALADAAWLRWKSIGGVAELTAIQLLGHALAASDAAEPARAVTLMRAAHGAISDTAPSASDEPRET